MTPPVPRAALRDAVIEAVGTLAGDLDAWWIHDRKRMVSHVCGYVRSTLRQLAETPATDEEIIDALVIELRRRGVDISGVIDLGEFTP